MIALKNCLLRAGGVLICALLCFAVALPEAGAQNRDTASMVPVNIIRSGYGVHITSDTGEMDKLVGDVELEHEGSLMYCDSAYLNAAQNSVEAFGNVHIIQPGGTEVRSDYLRYTGNTKLAFLKGNVNLTDGKDQLWCETLHYYVGTKTGIYDDGGTLQSDQTIVTSNSGTYYVNLKDARFTGDVHVTDPEYTVVSDDLGYNTNTKIVVFYAQSVVVNNRSELRTSNGYWDSRQEKGLFISRSSIKSEAQYIEADTIDYDRTTGFGYAFGQVVAIDTAQETTLYSGYAEYNEITRKLWATIRPVMKKMNGSDSLFIRADTFYAAPVRTTGDSLAQGAVQRSPDTLKPKDGKSAVNSKKTKRTAASVAVKTPRPASSPEEDSVLRYFIGYHHVRIFSDSLQGSCDSISYSQVDSVMRMIYDPVLWSRNSQITGDTILLYTDSGSLSRMFVPNKALVVSQSGPEKARMFDQIQGRSLIGHFLNNALNDMLVWPEAESIYYATDDDGAYIGVSQAKSERIRMLFRDQKISRIIFERDVKQSMTPLDQVEIGALKLSRFRWLDERRPKSLEELFR